VAETALETLDLEPADNGFRASNLGAGGGVVFGGQLLAQSIVAAAHTQPDKEVKSIHTVFTRSARDDQPVDLVVNELHRGRAFGSVAITIQQGDRVCGQSTVLLHAPDADLIRYAVDAPKAPDPDDLAERGETAWWNIRYDPAIDLADPDAVGPPELDVWTRFPDTAGRDLTTSQALLAYASDGFLIATAMRPHRGIGQSMAHRSISTTVLAHTISFHEPFDASQWLLLAHESPVAGRGRSFGRANVFTRDGHLVASYVQDNMIRDFPEGQAPAAGERAAH
jgi:acyl-CoA thioesterase